MSGTVDSIKEEALDTVEPFQIEVNEKDVLNVDEDKMIKQEDLLSIDKAEETNGKIYFLNYFFLS